MPSEILQHRHHVYVEYTHKSCVMTWGPVFQVEGSRLAAGKQQEHLNTQEHSRSSEATASSGFPKQKCTSCCQTASAVTAVPFQCVHKHNCRRANLILKTITEYDKAFLIIRQDFCSSVKFWSLYSNTFDEFKKQHWKSFPSCLCVFLAAPEGSSRVLASRHRRIDLGTRCRLVCISFWHKRHAGCHRYILSKLWTKKEAVKKQIRSPYLSQRLSLKFQKQTKTAKSSTASFFCNLADNYLSYT